MNRFAHLPVLLGLALLFGAGPSCGKTEDKHAPDGPTTAVERELQPAPPAVIRRALETVGGDADPASRPWVMRWPLRNVDVTSPYGIRMHPVVKRWLFHAGIDFRANRGDPVLAAGPGRVVKAGWMALTGNTVILQHPGALATLYAHLDQLLVFEGEPVEAGAPVGLIGSTGRSTGPHLHFTVYRLRGKERHPLDPADFVGRVIDPKHPPTPPLPPPTRPRPGGAPTNAQPPRPMR